MNANDFDGTPVGELNCEDAWGAMSAAADAEATSAEQQLLAAHLTGCTGCRELSDRIAKLDRHVRLRSAEPVPDLVAPILARARPAVLGRGG